MKRYLALILLCVCITIFISAQNTNPNAKTTNERLLLLEEKQNNVDKELEKTKKDLEEKFELKKENLEAKSKLVDWWLTALGILVTLFGVGVPIVLGVVGFRYAKKIDDEVEKSKKRIDDFISLYEKYLIIQKDLFDKKVTDLKEEAENDVGRIINLKKEAEKNARDLMDLSREQPTPEVAEKGKELAKKVIEDKASTDIEKAIGIASELYYSDKFDEVVKKYEELIQNKFIELTKEQLSTLYFQLAYSYGKLNNVDKSIEYSTKTLADRKSVV